MKKLAAWLFAAVLAPVLAPVLALAEPIPYELDAKGTTVGFAYRAQGASATGQLPIAGAKVILDFQRVGASTFEVQLDATRGTAGFAFADAAMRGADMLDAANHPVITFRSQTISATEGGADVTGLLTLRGQTHPVSLKASFFRQAGTEPGSLDKLAIKLTGVLDRHKWGVSGFRSLVEPRLDLEIVALINRS